MLGGVETGKGEACQSGWQRVHILRQNMTHLPSLKTQKVKRPVSHFISTFIFSCHLQVSWFRWISVCLKHLQHLALGRVREVQRSWSVPLTGAVMLVLTRAASHPVTAKIRLIPFTICLSKSITRSSMAPVWSRWLKTEKLQLWPGFWFWWHSLLCRTRTPNDFDHEINVMLT